jgi:hypothetical protein
MTPKAHDILGQCLTTETLRSFTRDVGRLGVRSDAVVRLHHAESDRKMRKDLDATADCAIGVLGREATSWWNELDFVLHRTQFLSLS